jgi:hypothetical protein
MYRRETISMEEIEQAASSWGCGPSTEDVFSEGDVEKIVSHMETANKVMIHDGFVHLI